MTRTSTFATLVDQNLVAGYDVGATKVDVLVRNTVTGEIVFERRYNACDFRSLEALLFQSFRDLGARPGRIVLAVAGPRQSNGDVQMSSDELGWPLFEAVPTAMRLGIAIETVNDMGGAAAGLATLVITEQSCLRPGTADPDGPKLLIGPGTGMGMALVLADGTLVSSEGGHAVWQPMTLTEYRYLEFLRAKYGTEAISVEQAASGGQGFDNLYDFLVCEGLEPSEELWRQVRQCRLQEKGIGELITSGALSGDPFCREAMELLGSILGQFSRTMALTTLPTGGIFFNGSVMQAPGVADYLVSHTSFLERFIAPGAKHADIMQTLSLHVVTDSQVAVKGALELAARMH
jgi:glucokinase